jgi:hypothetical protein
MNKTISLAIHTVSIIAKEFTVIKRIFRIVDNHH